MAGDSGKWEVFSLATPATHHLSLATSSWRTLRPFDKLRARVNTRSARCRPAPEWPLVTPCDVLPSFLPSFRGISLFPPEGSRSSPYTLHFPSFLQIPQHPANHIPADAKAGALSDSHRHLGSQPPCLPKKLSCFEFIVILLCSSRPATAHGRAFSQNSRSRSASSSERCL